MFFIQTLFEDPVRFLLICLIVSFSVCCHEYMHAFVAVREGDFEARGHLTLNPARQMGIMSILMLVFIGIAWGSVRVNRDNMRGRWSMLKVSLAGPFANVILMLFGFAGFALVGRYAPQNSNIAASALLIFSLLGVYNFVLFAFNMIPAPGLDGWGVVSELFPKLKNVGSELVRGIMLLIFLFAFIGVGFLFQTGYFILGAIHFLFIGGGGAAVG